MSSIRVGMIGLSARAKTSWASEAHLPYLQASNNTFAITALCNSSVSAAKAAIDAYHLPDSTKAYGNPEDMANDDEIDLVVCNTRADVHYETIKPSLLKGKDVYCEWPLAANLEDAKELNSIAKQKGSRTMVGLQGRRTPIVLKVKSLLRDEDRIGKVLSSCILASGGTRTRDSLTQGLKYFTQKKAGGNFITIGCGHMIDYVELVLGEFSKFNSHLTIQRPQVDIKGSDGQVAETVATEIPDHMMLQGTLVSGAPLSVVLRRGPPFKGDPGLTWLIHGEKGEIKITSASVSMHASDDDRSIAIHDFETDEIELLHWESQFDDLPERARNVAAMYEAFAKGDEDEYPGFEHAVLRQTQIEEIFRSSDEGREGSYL